jgi:uncharacterized OsmC-like protein
MADETLARAHVEPIHNYRFTATFPDLKDASGIAVDEAPPLGGGTGPNPAALLATAVGSCLAASLTFCLRKARIDASVAADAVAHVGRNEAGRFRIQGVDVTVTVKVAEADRARLERCERIFEDFCIVTESVRQGVPVKVELAHTPAEETLVAPAC